MKKEISGVTYTLIPIPPSLMPFSARILTLLQTTPKSVEDTREASAELKTLVKELLKGTCQPTPLEEHELEVYNVLVQLTNETLEKARLFRQKPGPNAAEGSSAGPVTPQTSK